MGKKTPLVHGVHISILYSHTDNNKSQTSTAPVAMRLRTTKTPQTRLVLQQPPLTDGGAPPLKKSCLRLVAVMQPPTCCWAVGMIRRQLLNAYLGGVSDRPKSVQQRCRSAV